MTNHYFKVLQQKIYVTNFVTKKRTPFPPMLTTKNYTRELLPSIARRVFQEDKRSVQHEFIFGEVNKCFTNAYTSALGGTEENHDK